MFYKTDLECIKNIQDGENVDESLKLLIDRHSGIYIDTINKTMHTTSRDDIVKRDLLSEKDDFIYKCAQKFNSGINIKFSTFLGNQARWRCMNIFNAKKNYKFQDVETTFDVFDLPQIKTEVEKTEVLGIIGRILENYPDGRAKQIFNLRYHVGEKNKTMPWRKIAKKLDMSVQGCINIHNKLIKHIQNNYESSNH
jgi:hypothetical protein